MVKTKIQKRLSAKNLNTVGLLFFWRYPPALIKYFSPYCFFMLSLAW